MELKSRDALYSVSALPRFNRTFMELKYDIATFRKTPFKSFNRTFMELKLMRE